MEYDELLNEFAQSANTFHSWSMVFNLQLESEEDRQASENLQQQAKSIETLRQSRSIEAKCKEVEEKQEIVKKVEELYNKLNDTRFNVFTDTAETLKLYTKLNSADLCHRMNKLQQRVNDLHTKYGM